MGDALTQDSDVENEKQLSDSVGISDELAISSRHYLALEHLWAALNNARLCRELEVQLLNKVAFDSEHRAYAMGAVISAVAFLEALINETYEDAGDEEHVSERVSALSETVRQRLATFWKATNGTRYIGVLDAANMALLLADKDQLPRGSIPIRMQIY